MKLHYGWVVVAAGALMSCVAIGTMFSLAVFLQPMSEATGWSRTGISSAMTIVFVTMGFAAFGWGALTDRFGPRIVVLAGGLLLGLGLALASRATSLLEFQLIYGIVVGGAAGAVFAPTIATVTAHGPVIPRPNRKRRVGYDESCQAKWTDKLKGERNGVRFPSANPASV